MKLAIALKASRFISKVGLKVAKCSPEILLGAGIVTGVASTVVACKATLKADEVLDEHKENIEKIKEAAEVSPEEYTEKDKKRDVALAYGKTIGGFVKLYSPAIVLGAVSITCFCASYGILKKRNVALMAAYGELLTKFNKYRDKVKYKYGEEADREIIFGDGSQDEIALDENGNVEFVKREELCSRYAKFFDSSNANWEKSPEYNMTFLTKHQNYFNDRLKARGHVFLNEVYDALGFEHTSEGALVGWVYNGDGDNYIDFGIYDASKDANRRFVNGYESVILLDFNVDGVIYDKI